MKVKLTKTEYNQMRKRLISLKESKDPEDVTLLNNLARKATAYKNQFNLPIDLDLLIMWYLNISITYTPFFLEQILEIHDKAQAN